jgi:hypothetical protein
MPVRPHVTSQLPDGQFVTVQPDGGHVMLQSGPPAQSTLQLAACVHSTWHSSPVAQPTSHGSPGAHWM